MARSILLTGGFHVAKTVDDAFPLFSPLGEKAWVADWSPELIHPRGVDWGEGQIFRTEELYGDAVWIVAKLDPFEHRVRYFRVEPGHVVARVDVRCRTAAIGGTDVTVEYQFVSLSPSGDDAIAAMTQEGYDEKMKNWERLIAAI